MPLAPSELRPLLRLCLVPGVGSQRLTVLLRHFGSADGALRAPYRSLSQLPGLGPSVARAIATAAGPGGEGRARAAEAAMARSGAVALLADDPHYPASFRVLPEPPAVLFAAGDPGLLDGGGIAMVGTRAPSAYGVAAAAGLAGELSAAGYPVVSGMARGIDTAAHRAALGGEGRSVGVLGHGIDQVYPPENRDLFRRMRQAGLLITEMPPGERPRAGNFPRRNRLIAALSRAVVVVEMGFRSGAQHTVNYALELGREVMAVPGPIGAPTSEGTNQLIRDGARVVTCARDVLEELDGVGALRRPAALPPVQPALPLMAPDEERVVRALGAEPVHVDDIAAGTEIGAPQLLGLLLGLELRGVVAAAPGMRYRLA